MRVHDRVAMAALTLGLIGNGAIARQLARYCASAPAEFKILGALVKPGEVCAGDAYPLTGKLLELIELRPSLIVECAGHQAVHKYGVRILRMGIDLVLISVGALCDEDLLAELRRAEAAGGGRLILVAGALPGWDTLQTASLADLESVTLYSSKPPQAWRGTLAEKECRLDGLGAPVTLFDGSAREAARLYPKNANIAATAALAGVGFEKTRVVLIADPAIRQNIHQLEVRGAFGQFSMEIAANPSPDNPKTSLIAAMSILRVLKQEASARRAPPSRKPRRPVDPGRISVAVQEAAGGRLA
jgi:aspartate dehydrogenase